MTRPGARAVTAGAAATWVLLHAGQAVAFRDEHREPALLWGALLLALLLSVGAAAPLVRRDAPLLGVPTAMVLAAGTVAVALGVQPFLTSAGLTGHANWPTGGMCVVVAALVLRGRPAAATAAAAGLVAVNSLCVWTAHQEHPEVALSSVLLLAVPPVTWLSGAVAIRALVERSDRPAEGRSSRQRHDAAEVHVSRAVREAGEGRRDQLREQVLPLLRRLAEQPTVVDEDTRQEAARVAVALRDDLRARSLLTDSLRAHLRSARARGVQVSLSCDGTSTDSTCELARTLLGEVVDTVPAGTSVTCRVTSRPPVTVLVVRAAEQTLADVAGLLTRRAARAGVAASVDTADGELVARLVTGPVPEAGLGSRTGAHG